MTRTRHACIVGIGATEYRRRGEIRDRSEFQLAVEAICAAVADAGLDLKELDGFATYSEARIDASVLQMALGLPALRFSSAPWGGRGGGSCAALAHAAMAVEGGRADNVVVFRSIAQGQSRRYGAFDSAREHANMTAPFGLFAAPQMLALVLQRYAHEFALAREDMAEVALVCRDNASRNPRAIMHGRPLTMPQYMAGRPIADPLTLYDCCLESDGACAVVVSSFERARDLAHKPVEIVHATGFGDAGWCTGPMGSHNVPADAYATGGQTALARELFGRAGLTPADVDVAQFYDHFTGMVLLALEDFGFCARGDGPAFARGGGLAARGGRLPINTAGGNLSEAYVHGLNHVAEAVRQLRGESTTQVIDAHVCLVTGGSGPSPTSAALLAA